MSAVFLWCLAHQSEFEGVKFANAVDVPANETKERGVDLVPIRPDDYQGQRGLRHIYVISTNSSSMPETAQRKAILRCGT